MQSSRCGCHFRRIQHEDDVLAASEGEAGNAVAIGKRPMLSSKKRRRSDSATHDDSVRLSDFKRIQLMCFVSSRKEAEINRVLATVSGDNKEGLPKLGYSTLPIGWPGLDADTEFGPFDVVEDTTGTESQDENVDDIDHSSSEPGDDLLKHPSPILDPAELSFVEIAARVRRRQKSGRP
jgi:hypothetical protein